MPLIRKGGPAAGTDGQADDAAVLLRTGNADQRWSAARALSGQAQAVAVLGEALGAESDSRVREAILTALARSGAPEAALAIIPLIRSDEASLRTGAIDALRLMPQALQLHLSALLNDPDPDVRLLACDLARDIPAPQASGLLCDLLARETEVNVCAAAVEILADCGGPDALPALEACAKRFADVPFLCFSLNIAAERIRAQSPGHDG